MRFFVPALLAFCISAQAQPGGSGAPGFTLQGSAMHDGAWLQLTRAENNSLGTALQAGEPIAVGSGLLLSFSYVAWGGGEPGGDGLSVFLYDASKDMSGAKPGGGLGYCQGAGGWLAIGIDEFGNFSNAADFCGSGPGPQPQSIVLRGPVDSRHAFIGRARLPQRVDAPAATQRPTPAQIAIYIAPKTEGTGYRVDVDWRSSPKGEWRRILWGADFPYTAPPLLRVGVAASTGGARNVHEVRDVTVTHLAPPRVDHAFVPARLRVGESTTLVLKLTAAAGQKTSLLHAFNYELPPGVRVAKTLQLGGTCPGGIRAVPGDKFVTIDAGTTALAAGCTLSVRLDAVAGGQWGVKMAPGTWAFDLGPNAQEAVATVIVEP